jgi:hypothetical protein
VTDGGLTVLATRPWPGSALAASRDGEWVAVALPGRVVVARLPYLDDVREIDVSDVRSLVAVDPGRLALAPRRGLLVIDDPAGTPRVGVRARGPGRLVLATDGEGRVAAVGDRAALPRATVVARSDAARRRDWTAAIHGARCAAWLEGGDLVVAAGEDLVLVRGGREEARACAPLGEVITALASVPGGVAVAGPGPRVLLHSVIPGATRPHVEIPPGTGRSLSVTGDILVASTRSLGERVTMYRLSTGEQVHEMRGVAVGAAAPPYVVATGREGTVVVGPEAGIDGPRAE